jgi:hypothetical protein
MRKPDYDGGSIVNLTCSIAKSYKAKAPNKPLKALPPKRLRKKTVLFLLDGLGYEYLMKRHPESFLAKHCEARITSVFPSTTPTTVTSLLTGLTPQEHGNTGWFVYLKELGAVAIILRYVTRCGLLPLPADRIPIEKIIRTPALMERFACATHALQPHYLVDTQYTKAMHPRSKIHGYRSVKDMMAITKQFLKTKKAAFVYVYWPEIDASAHGYGVASVNTAKRFHEIDKAIANLAKTIDDDTTLLVTADHGLIDTTPQRRVMLESHPQLEDCLALPLCAEPRAAYCYLKPGREAEFRRYMKKHLPRYHIEKSETLRKKGLFGKGKEHPRFHDRIGDLVILPEENRVINDRLLGHGFPTIIGNHGGLSQEELYVPLIVVQKNSKI